MFPALAAPRNSADFEDEARGVDGSILLSDGHLSHAHCRIVEIFPWLLGCGSPGWSIKYCSGERPIRPVTTIYLTTIVIFACVRSNFAAQFDPSVFCRIVPLKPKHPLRALKWLLPLSIVVERPRLSLSEFGLSSCGFSLDKPSQRPHLR